MISNKELRDLVAKTPWGVEAVNRKGSYQRLVLSHPLERRLCMEVVNDEKKPHSFELRLTSYAKGSIRERGIKAAPDGTFHIMSEGRCVAVARALKSPKDAVKRLFGA